MNNEEKLESLLKTTKAKMTAKADEVKAIERTLEEFRVEKEKQVDKKIETEASVTLPPHFATMFNVLEQTSANRTRPVACTIKVLFNTHHNKVANLFFVPTRCSTPCCPPFIM